MGRKVEVHVLAVFTYKGRMKSQQATKAMPSESLTFLQQGPMNEQGCFYDSIPPGQLEHAGGKGPSPESVSSLEPNLRLLLKPKSLKPPVFDPKDGESRLNEISWEFFLKLYRFPSTYYRRHSEGQ